MKSRVDPFIPVPSAAPRSRPPLRPERPQPTTVPHALHREPLRGRTLDGFGPRRPTPAVTSHPQVPVQPPAAAVRPLAPRHAPSAQKTHQAQPQPSPVVSTQHTAARTQVHAQQRQPSLFRRFLRYTQMLLLIVGAVALGFVIQYPPIGYALIGVYAIFVLVRRVRSRVTFTLALISVAAALAARSLQREEGVADSFAVYTFLLLAIGTVSFLIEVFRANKRIHR